MGILLVNGSSRVDGSNARLLQGIVQHFSAKDFTLASDLSMLPLFNANDSIAPLSYNIKEWKNAVSSHEAIVISTPVYIHNIPAVLKNALEWTTASGEFCGKPILPITYTPHAPRGEKAMQSLLWSLQALDTNIVASLHLYKNEISTDDLGHLQGDQNTIDLLGEALKLLLSKKIKNGPI